MSDIKSVVEPIVDSLTNLIVECVNGSMKDVTNHCMTLATGTEGLVQISQKVAIESDDADLTNDIINSINFISDKIEGLVVAFTELFKNVGNADYVSKFSTAAQDVADAINNLVLITDDTSQKRISGLLRKAIQSTRALDSVLDTKNQAELATNSAKFVELHKRLADVSTRASASTSIQRKKQLLQSGSDEISSAYPEVNSTIRVLFTSPSEKSSADYNSASSKLGAAYRYLVDACKIDEVSDFARLREVVLAVTSLIHSAKELQTASSDLIVAISKDEPRTKRAALGQSVSKHGNEVIESARVIAANINDPVLKSVVENSIVSLEAALSELVRIANLDTLTPADKRKAADEYETLMNSTQKIITSSRSDASHSYPIHITSEALNNTIDSMVESAQKGDVNATDEHINEANALGKKLVQLLVEKAKNTSDPNEKRYLLETADAIRKSLAEVTNNARILAQDPTSTEAANNLTRSRRDFRQAIDRARGVESTPDGFFKLPTLEDDEPEEEVVMEERPVKLFNFDFEALADDDELVKAAKDQARAALDVIREAEKYVAGLSDDPESRKKITEVSNNVRDLAAKVVEAATKASNNPDDSQAQNDMSKYQGELATEIGKLLGLIGKGTDEGVARALKDLEDVVGDTDGVEGSDDSGDVALANDFFKVANEIIKKVTDNFEKAESGDIQKDVNHAREIATLSTNGNKVLQNLAKTIKAEAFKVQISNAGKIVSDNALKLKILAAVKASGGEDSAGQVSAAALGLKVQVQDIVSQLKAGFLRHRVQSTAKQALALKQIAEAVRRAKFY